MSEIAYYEDLVDDIARNKGAYLEILGDDPNCEKIKDLYKKFLEEIEKHNFLLRQQQLKAVGSFFATESHALSHKQHKVNPAIAGGAASGVFGPVGGVIAASNAMDRNAAIDAKRSATESEAIAAKVSLQTATAKSNSQGFEVMQAAQKISEELDKNPQIAEERKRVREEHLAAVEEAANSAVYKKASAAAISNSPRDLAEAIALFETLGDYQDSKEKLTEVTSKREKVLARNKKLKKIGIIAVAAIVVIAILGAIVNVTLLRPNRPFKAFDGLVLGQSVEDVPDDVEDKVITINGVKGHLGVGRNGDTISSLHWASFNSNVNSYEIVETARSRIIEAMEAAYGPGEDVIFTEANSGVRIIGEDVFDNRVAWEGTQFVSRSGLVYLVGPDSRYHIYVFQIDHPIR